MPEADRIHTTRRTILKAGSGAALAASGGLALAGAAGEEAAEPLLALWAAFEVTTDRLNAAPSGTPEADELFRRQWWLIEAMVATPPRTLDGLAVQVALLRQLRFWDCQDESIYAGAEDSRLLEQIGTSLAAATGRALAWRRG